MEIKTTATKIMMLTRLSENMLYSFVPDQNPRKKLNTQLYALNKVLSKNLSNQAISYRIFKMQS